MRFEDHRHLRAADRPDEAELFYRDLMGEPARIRGRGQRFHMPPAADRAAEAAVGQASISERHYMVEPSGEAIARGASLDDVLLRALERRAGHLVVLGDAAGGTSFAAHSWGSAAELPTPRTIEFDATGVAALILNGGARVYVQADPVASSASARLLWVHVPSVEEFLRLPSAQRTSQRRDWARVMQRAGVVNPATRAAFTTAELGALASPILRTLLAHNAAGAFPVDPVRRDDRDRGGRVRGVTLPMIRYPIGEPQVYLRVISMAEGKMESINAWDAMAGISLGPIQINVQRGALFRFLWSVWQEDRRLFTAAFGNDYTMRRAGAHPELSVTVAGQPVWLRGTSAQEDVRRNYAYFQSADPARSAVTDIDADHRRRMARRFAGLVAWPHVQEVLEDVSTWWLQPGLDQIHAAGIPALDPNRPDADLFVLKSLLMSTYVRFSGCLAPLLTALEPWATARDKLAHWQGAVAGMEGPCSAGGNEAQRKRNARLRERLERQHRDARSVFSIIETILAARRGAPPATAGASLSLEPRTAADLFDRLAAGDESAAHAHGLRMSARPGEPVPSRMGDRAFMLTRAWGEGRFGVMRALREIAPGEWQMEGTRVPLALRHGDVLPADRFLVEQPSPLITRCGFFGPDAQRSEQQVRDAVRDAAVAEWTVWHSAGVPRPESDIAMFGHLVRYYLSAMRALRPDTLTAIQTAARGPIAYGPVPASTAAEAVVDSWARRVRGLLLAGLPNTAAPAGLASHVDQALKHARHAHLGRGAFRAWSAAWVAACVRGAGILLGLEAVIQGRPSGGDALLLASTRHAEYTIEAHRRRAGPNATGGTYHAFSPTARAPVVGDIIVQDRQAAAPSAPLTFAQIDTIAGGRELHGDIVTEVAADHVVTIGGNVGDSCRRRRYPMNGGTLVVDRGQLYVSEDDAGSLPALPETSTGALHTRSTLRIFALLGPVEVCAAVPGQPYRGGVLT